MGFRTGAFAKVWKTENKGNYSVVELSTSKKNKETEEYETDFSSKFVRFIGTAHQEIGDYTGSIKLGDIEVTNSYNKETKVSYTNFLVYSFEIPESNNSGTKTNNKTTANTSSNKTSKTTNNKSTSSKNMGMMNIPDGIDESLPFN
jgi:hypothetical protein